MKKKKKIAVSHWFREMELARSEPFHPITSIPPATCYACTAHASAFNDGHNSWRCRKCSAWLAQVEAV